MSQRPGEALFGSPVGLTGGASLAALPDNDANQTNSNQPRCDEGSDCGGPVT